MVLIFSLSISALASENSTEQINATIEEVDPNEEFIITNPETMISENPLLRGSSKPSKTSVHNLNTAGQYNFDFTCLYGGACYSAKNFTGTSTLRLYINASSGTSKGMDYTVKVFNRVSGATVATYTRNTGRDHKTNMVMTGLKTGNKYYFKISASKTIKGSGKVFIK